MRNLMGWQQGLLKTSGYLSKKKIQMKVAIYSSHGFEKDHLLRANRGRHTLTFLKTQLSAETASSAGGHDAVCLFVNDDAGAGVLEKLAGLGIKHVALRSAGFNHINLETARRLGMRVANVPEYSPYAVAEHTVTLMLALNRRLIRAHNRVMELNFSLDGLTGFDMHRKTVGIVGMGKIGLVVAQILKGFGCRLLGYDVSPNPTAINELGVEFVDMDTLCRESHIITLHAPLLPATRYLIDAKRLEQMKDGVMLINTSRGGLINTKDVIKGLKSGKVGYLGLDVYEEEQGLFFEDHSANILQDDKIARLMTFKNVLITSHQAFLTHEALTNIADTTLFNLNCFEEGAACENEITAR
jgi:D-lactate dehydrogenase